MKLLIKISLHIFISLVLFIQFGHAQENKAYKDLDAYINKAVEDFAVPGLAVGIIKNGEVVYIKGFGERNRETQELATSETIFGIASCSKAFTAACLAILVDEGKIKWDDNVTDYLPDFQLFDPYITKDMIIEDLLCHRSGLGTFDGDLLWYGTDYSRKEVLDRIRFRENPHKLRESFGYSNVMFIAAGEVVESVTGKSWDEFIEERIFEPLEMESSNTSNTLFTETMNIAYPHIEGQPLEFINYDNCGPAASINTSANDLINWVRLMLNKGIYNGDTIFSSDQYYKLTSPHTLLNRGHGETIGGTHFYSYGLGWFLFDYRGRKVIQHGGGLPGFHSKVCIVPEDSLGYVIIANQLSGLVESVHKKILDFYLSDPMNPEENKDWATIYLEGTKKQEEIKKLQKTEKEQNRIKGTKTSLNLEEYAGVYNDEMYGNAQIKYENEQLTLILLPSETLFTGILEHWQDDTFRFKFKDEFLPEGFLSFHFNEAGMITDFTIDLKNPDFHFYKLKFKKDSDLQ